MLDDHTDGGIDLVFAWMQHLTKGQRNLLCSLVVGSLLIILVCLLPYPKYKDLPGYSQLSCVDYVLDVWRFNGMSEPEIKAALIERIAKRRRYRSR